MRSIADIADELDKALYEHTESLGNLPKPWDGMRNSEDFDQRMATNPRRRLQCGNCLQKFVLFKEVPWRKENGPIYVVAHLRGIGFNAPFWVACSIECHLQLKRRVKNFETEMNREWDSILRARYLLKETKSFLKSNQPNPSFQSQYPLPVAGCEPLMTSRD